MAILWGCIAALCVVLPLAWKWQLGIRRVGLFVIVTGIICGLIIAPIAPTRPSWAADVSVAVVTLGISVGFLAYRFYRDPERTPPRLEGAIVSPADGIVIYVKRSNQGQVPITTKHGRHCPLLELLKTPFYSSEAWVIGVSMSLLDVHVNRAPVAGTVTFQKHFPGRFGSLRLAERVFDNERATAIIQTGELQVAVVQIASRLVRQIVSYVKVGEQVARGQRIGAIRLGSQVDVVLPVRDDLRVTVHVGEQLLAGESVLATYNNTANAALGVIPDNGSVPTATRI